MAGRSAVGKSTLVFGEQLALTSVGKPATTKTSAYTHKTNLRNRIHHTKEWEDEMRSLVEHTQSEECWIHLVWFVVVGESFEDFEATVCNEVFK